MNVLPYLAASLIVGALITFQPPMNAILTRATGNPFGATVISILVALTTALLILTVTGRGDLSRAALTSVPWWVYLAGVIGALYVASGAVIAPVTGGLLFFVCVIAGQLIGATIIDHFGAFGLAVREITIWRVMGLVLVMSGAVMVLRG
jgi:transporter family-2 protein